jgi:DNA polymerase III subunit alpha
MPIADFIHLRTHSAYSLSSGAIKVKELVVLAKSHAMPAVAMTDAGNLFGALEFAMAAREAGVQPIVGCELALRRADGEGRLAGRQAAPDPVLLLVRTEAGYLNLLKLVSHAFLETQSGEEPQITLAALEGHSDGLILLTGGPRGPVGRLLAEGQATAAEAMLLRLKSLFPGALYVELMRHGLPSEDRIEEPLIDLALKHDLPLVATNDVFFPDPGYYEAHDALLCIAEGTVVSNPNRRRLTPNHHFKPPASMRKLFADVPEACDNTLVIARRCAYMPEPRAPILPPYASANGGDEKDELRAAAAAGLEQRLAVLHLSPEAEAPYRARLQFELETIIQMGFAGYFLIVAEFIQWAKSEGIPVGPGRGSGAGSVVAWSLTITDLDPLRFGLLFERFLNPERVSMPDFDIDFCQDRRDEVIRHVQERYGRDKVAQIITFGKLQARAVLRDVGRVLEMPYGQVDRLCKLVPNNPAKPVTLQEAIDGEPQLQAIRDGDESVQRLIEISLKLEGLYRHASTHAAGVVIGDRPLEELIPLYRDPRSDMPVTQFNMKYVELAGLVKFDFLGLKTLDVLDAAQRLLARRNVTFDLGLIPLDDPKTYEMLGRGDAMGVFQFESSGMRDLLRQAKPQVIEDLIALVALFRPGPMENIPKYLACKHGREKPEFMHETIEPIVKETYGVIIYQEQVLQIAQVFAGYSLGSADLLRRAMGKKIKSEMDAQRDVFIAGAKARGVTPERASYVFELVEKFAGYGFNKAHSACYALVAYQTAWLKANYPVEFMAALMSLEFGNTDKLNLLRQECDRLGIRLLPPDVTRSGVAFTVEATAQGPAIRYALAAVKGVGAQGVQQLVDERTEKGRFADLFDFARRLDPKGFNRRQFESLVKAGAFDALNRNRAQTFAAIDLLLRHAASAANDRATQQVNLFAASSAAAPAPVLPACDDWPPAERLQHEFDSIGFYLSSHPLDAYARNLARIDVVRFADLPARLAAGGSTRFRLAGVPIARRERNSARGSRFAFIQMSDTSGVFEVMAFAEVLAQSRQLLDEGVPLVVTVDVRTDDESQRLSAQKFERLDRVATAAAAGLKIVLTEGGALVPLKNLMLREGGGRGRVSVVVPVAPAREVEIALPGGFRIGPDVLLAVRALPGVLEVQDL